MKWYVPSWNGDIRLVDAGDSKSVLVVIDPTESERKLLARFQETATEKGWWKGDAPFDVPAGDKECGFDLGASAAEVGPALVRAYRGMNPAVLTAVRFSDGGIETAAGTSIDLDALAKKIAAEEEAKEASEKPDKHGSRSYREPKGAEKQPDPEPKDTGGKKAEATASVKRPTPCCPQCVPGSIEPAREVLLEFLSPEQHEMWAKHRQILVVGNMSGARYLISHRHSPRAQKQGRICYDVDHDVVVHFHDTSVPPEEEVLATKLIMEHRESWLRNEATYFSSIGPRYKNPFGDGGDGTMDAAFTQGFGQSLVETIRQRVS